MFAKQWFGKVDDVVVVDDHITGVLSEHQAGKLLGVPETGIKLKGRRSTPGRYFQVAEPGTSWGGTNIDDPLSILGKFNAKKAWPGLRLLMVSTTGEHYAYFELDDEPQAPRNRVAREPARIGGAHQGELRTCAVHGTFHGRRRRIVARGRDRESGEADALGARRVDPRDLRRRTGLCLARRRDHLHGRRHAHAAQCVSDTSRHRRWWLRSNSR